MPNPKVIRVRGARTHNLKNVSVEIPLNAVTVISGVSGSGKSSLAFDTLYAEAQRRYVESLSIRARQAMDLLPRADVETIDNLPAAVAIEQKTLVRNPRSTVGTITELSDALRLLFARTGQPFCPEHGEPLSAQTVAEMVERTLERSVELRILITAPLSQSDEVTVRRLAPWSAKGYTRFVAEGVVHEMEEAVDLPERTASLELVVDRLRVRDEQRERLAESFESAAKIGNGRVLVREMDSRTLYGFRLPRLRLPLPAFGTETLLSEPSFGLLSGMRWHGGEIGFCTRSSRGRRGKVARSGGSAGVESFFGRTVDFCRGGLPASRHRHGATVEDARRGAARCALVGTGIGVRRNPQ